MKLTVLIVGAYVVVGFVLWAFCRAAASTPPLTLPSGDWDRAYEDELVIP